MNPRWIPLLADAGPPWAGNLLLYLLGLGLIFAEVFLPSGGLIILVAFLCIGYALFQLFEAGHDTVAWIAIAVGAVYLVGTGWWSMLRLRQDAKLGGFKPTSDQPKDLPSLIGKRGIALTVLRPAGTIRIDGERYDAVSRGDFIEAGAAVEVVDVSSGRIMVRTAAAETTPADDGGTLAPE